MVENGSKTAQEPDVEVVILGEGRELATMAFFQAAAGVWDVLVGIDDSSNRQPIIDVLQLAVEALRKASFYEVDAAETAQRLLDALNQAPSLPDAPF